MTNPLCPLAVPCCLVSRTIAVAHTDRRPLHRRLRQSISTYCAECEQVYPVFMDLHPVGSTASTGSRSLLQTPAPEIIDYDGTVHVMFQLCTDCPGKTFPILKSGLTTSMLTQDGISALRQTTSLSEYQATMAAGEIIVKQVDPTVWSADGARQAYILQETTPTPIPELTPIQLEVNWGLPIGIAVACVVIVVLAVFACWWFGCCCCGKQRKQTDSNVDGVTQKPKIIPPANSARAGGNLFLGVRLQGPPNV